MITCANIAGNGSDYLGRHLSSNDYYEEGKEVTGEWFGKAVEHLGLVAGSAVTAAQFSAVGNNRHPVNGEKITPQDSSDRKAWTDIQLSAPKDVSIALLVGGDARIEEAFKASVRVALGEMQRFASVRERRGAMHGREESRATGNMAAALYFHDASRSLDPQLHCHAVTGNLTWDEESGRFLALQSRTMMEASLYARRVLYDDLAARLEKFGYRIENETADGFNLVGITDDLRRKFSTRDQQIEEKAREFEAREGRPPTKNERAVITRESRDKKLREITTPEVRAAQRARLDATEAMALADLVAAATARPVPSASPTPLGQGEADRLLDGAFRHHTERASVASVGAVLATVYAHREPGAGRLDASALHDALHARATGPAADLHLGDGFRVTTREVAERERETAFLALGGRERYAAPLASVERLAAGQKAALATPGAKRLSEDQRAAALTLAASRDAVSILQGDAGTGKTYTLETVRAASACPWVALGPTTGAARQLKAEGFEQSDTVQKFLKSRDLQESAHGAVILVDEAGLLSMKDMRQLLEIGRRVDARILLVGDPKQHHSVEEGDALRAVLVVADRQAAKQGEPSLVTARLREVRRQEHQEHREISDLIAGGNPVDALERQTSLGLVREEKNERRLFEAAADHYMARAAALAVERTGKAKTTSPDLLGIARTWADIDRFSGLVRERKRAAGELVGEDRVLQTIRPLNWTDEQAKVASRYEPGKHVLTFQAADESLGVKPGENWLVTAKDKDGLTIRRLDTERPRSGKKANPLPSSRRIGWDDLGGVDVGQTAEIRLAPGDQIQLRANCREGRKLVAANGDVRTVKSVGRDGRLNLIGGGQLPASFRNYTLGYAVTSHKSQGASVRETVVIAGAESCASVDAAAHYVSSTRHKDTTALFLADLTAYGASLKRSVARGLGRELASEMNPASTSRRKAELQSHAVAPSADGATTKQSDPPKRKGTKTVNDNYELHPDDGTGIAPWDIGKEECADGIRRNDNDRITTSSEELAARALRPSEAALDRARQARRDRPTEPPAAASTAAAPVKPVAPVAGSFSMPTRVPPSAKAGEPAAPKTGTVSPLRVEDGALRPMASAPAKPAAAKVASPYQVALDTIASARADLDARAAKRTISLVPPAPAAKAAPTPAAQPGNPIFSGMTSAARRAANKLRTSALAGRVNAERHAAIQAAKPAAPTREAAVAKATPAKAIPARTTPAKAAPATKAAQPARTPLPEMEVKQKAPRIKPQGARMK